jgi:dihydroneopterin aldolase
MDFLHLTGIRVYGYLGVLPEEQVLGQWFEVNLTLGLDVSRAGETDRLEDTCDYRAIVKAIQELIRTARFKLIEKLATTIAELVLALSEIEEVKVKVTKLTPPIPDFGGSVSVEITRSRRKGGGMGEGREIGGSGGR